MVFYRINILQEMISDALRKILPGYSLQIAIVESTEQLFDAITERQVDIVIAEFSYLFNHKSWGAQTSSRLNMLCQTYNVKRVLFVPELQYGLLKKVLEMKYDLTLSLQDEPGELKRELQTLLKAGEAKPRVSSYLKGMMRAGARSRSVLSAREWEVLHLIVEGYTVTEIAQLRSRSASTIATQKHNAMKKLNLANHSELIKYLQMAGRIGS
ncbi:LuxR family transcriptional regulator [Enterobacter cloacae subsp. dissolvens]|nr:LuxR family transcriptional regulator [Enterobacter cloacae]KLQ42936.1 LuxR family transcriptional regulator [Enterobacter cloacae subsp. dissolvens]KZP72108.1 helix-turn-helix transcriptional regulator [Enterobacter cloacae subsp. dissolvens]KZQ33043.1 helix-turn-helix transcriptional regulator [Enterobacter cloacae subsp. dissolvens]